jgi:hypothetical protein
MHQDAYNYPETKQRWTLIALNNILWSPASTRLSAWNEKEAEAFLIKDKMFWYHSRVNQMTDFYETWYEHLASTCHPNFVGCFIKCELH